MPENTPVLVWMRHDLRMADNPALTAAAAAGPVAALFVLDDTLPHPMGGASRWWLHHSLANLKKDLAKYRIPLLLRAGPARSIVPALAQEIGVQAVYWNRVYEPAAITRDTEIKSALKSSGIEVQSYNASLLHEPWAIKNKQGNPFRVFTPFAKTCRTAGFAAPSNRPAHLQGARLSVSEGRLDDLGLHPSRPDWSGPLAAFWTIGEAPAQDRLNHFLEQSLGHYAAGRDCPGRDDTSRLSPHLHFGEIGPRQALEAATRHLHAHTQSGLQTGYDKFVAELLWREFSAHLLYAHPFLPHAPLDKKFLSFPWAEDEKLFRAWTKGQTGIPIVDAGMRQLWQTGWMHNRVRMIVASFLVKNLLQSWTHGAAWFWDTLVDADLASNTASWQWVAGCGADAAPYFRVFNPVLQGEKFDAEGDYVRRYVPELKNLPSRVIHAPWQASPLVLKDSGVEIGKNYPLPLVDLGQSRARALEAYARIKGG